MNTTIVRRYPSFLRSLWIGLALALTLGTGRPMRAASGDLDPLFGTGGKVITDFGGYSDLAEALVLQPDGKLVAAGSTTDGFGLARYNPDGTLDPTFGVAGKATVAFDGNLIAAAYALVLQPDGKLVAAGFTDDAKIVNGVIVFDYSFALARFNSNGSLDPSFGSSGTGTVTMHFGAGTDNYITALVLQPDGKLVAAGSVYNGSYYDFTLLRYNGDGTLDTSFGTGGKVTTDFGVGSYALALVLQPNGKLVAAGRSFVAGNSDFVLVRYNQDGTLDKNFGIGGKVATDFAGDRGDTANALVLQDDGKLVAGGGNGIAGFKLARYNMDGTLDSGFGAGGKVITNFGGGYAAINALVLQPDGKLAAAGSVYNGSSWDFVLARYDTEGALDATFGAGGQVVIDFVGFGPDQAADLVVQKDGMLVAAGHTYDGNETDPAGDTLDFALARYDPASTVRQPILTVVTTAGTGSGSVTSSPMEIDCGLTCKASFSTGTVVTLASTADPGSTFTGWSGDCSLGGAVTMTADKTCTATFTRIVHTLTATTAGTGFGTVTSNPVGIICGVTCAVSFPQGVPVTLTATPAPGSIFGGWSGDCDPKQGTVTMSTDKTCTATFNPLTVSTIALASSGSPSLVGQAVTITATVTGAAPTGVVTFTVDNGPPVTRTITATTSAATIEINLPAGQHSITASYLGDARNAGSTAAPLLQIVAIGESSGTATRVILAGTHNGSLFGQDRITGRFAADSDIRASDINLGISFAQGALPAAGPSVGVYDLTHNTPSVPFATYGIAGSRAIAYATWVNESSSQVTRDAHADLHGFLRGGVMEHAVAAVYVFDTNGFLATVQNSGTTMPVFLLGDDTLAAYSAANPATLSLGRLFPASVLKTSVFQSVTSSKSDTTVNNTMTTDLFMVDPGQSVIFVFDLTVYADKGGYADFASTLKPAPVFLTDAAGNPAPLTPVGLWSPAPPAAANLALTPAVAANALTAPVTLTATATTAAGAPVPNTQVFLDIIAGPNAQPLGPFVTDANGQITFTYAGGSATGTDRVQAHIGTLQSNVAQITWTAVPFTFAGFFAPVDMSTASLVVLNTVKAGQAVPMKWRLTSSGTPVTDPASFIGLSSYVIACPSGPGLITDAVEETAASSGLQYSGDGNWQFNWKTLPSYKNTCRSVTVKFSDGTTSPAATFSFK